MTYGISKTVSLSFEEAVDSTIAALKEKGFGILSDIDVKKTLQEKLGVDYKKYRILGACNPPRAHQALQQEEEIGLLLPCNVIVYEKEPGTVVISAVKPSAMFSVVENESLVPLAKEVESLLEQAIESV